MFQRYKELKSNMNSLFALMNEPTFNQLIIVEHTDVLLAGLSQLCLLPIAKPGTKIALESAIDELKYEQLIKEQKTFKNILTKKIVIDKDLFFIREVIFSIGHRVCNTK